MIKKIFSYIKLLVSRNKNVQNVIKNSGWLIGNKVVTMLVGVFVIALIARYFGPEQYGKFSYAQSFVALFSAISTLGLDTISVKSILEKKYNEGEILYTSLILRLIGGIILSILVNIFIYILEPYDELLHELVFIISLSMLLKAFDVIEYWIFANQRAKISAIVRIVVFIIISLLKIYVVLSKGTLIEYGVIFIIESMLLGLLLFLTYFRFRENIYPLKFNILYAKETISQSWYIILSGLMVTLYMKIDQVMLGKMMKTTSELGIYSAAVQIANMWYFVPMALITSFKPIIIKKKQICNNNYLKTMQLLYTLITWMSIIFCIFISLFSNQIVVVLYGEEYLKSSNILLLSCWAGTFAMLGSARGIWLICEGLQKYSIFYVGIGAIINVIINYILIPHYGGYGAAVATLASQITVAIIAPYFIKDTKMSTVMMLKSFIFEGLK